MAEHTKEPWFYSETDDGFAEITNDERAAGEYISIAEVPTGFSGKIGAEQEANARRIVACVNACEGIPRGVLEKQGMVPIEQVTHDIERQRDKLLAALEGLTNDIHSLIYESSGVAGLHLNGDLAPWHELEAGGRFERLTHLPDAFAAIAEVKGCAK